MLGAGAGVEVAGGLVGEEDLGTGAEGPGQRHPLLLAAGELGRIVVAAVAEADALEQVRGALAGLLASELQRDLDVLPRGERRNQLERLEDESDLLASHPGSGVLVQRAQLLAVEMDGPGRRADPVRRAGPSRVVLPLPEGPTIAAKPPGSTEKVISFSTVSSRPPER